MKSSKIKYIIMESSKKIFAADYVNLLSLPNDQASSIVFADFFKINRIRINQMLIHFENVVKKHNKKAEETSTSLFIIDMLSICKNINEMFFACFAIGAYLERLGFLL